MIITDPEILRQKSQPAQPKEVAEIIALLEKELINYERLGKGKGIGLAAPQIGIQKRVAIVRISPNYSVDLVNCRIEHTYDPFIFESEGCLSVPGINVNTQRYGEIHIVENLVESNAFIATGLMAICCAHEIDHWDGVLLQDRAIKKAIKQAPNDPCACGSIDEKTKKIKKYKKCCGRNI
jgi:peptide deformylase